MSSSSAILYPSFKGLEQSNSGFVQVSQSVKEMNRNSPLNHRTSASKAERGNRSKSKQNECVDRKEEFFINKRQQSEYLTNNERRLQSDKQAGDHNNPTEETNHCDKMTSADLKPKPTIEKSQQYDIRETGVNGEICSLGKNSENSAECAELSLTRPESIQGLITKHPKHTIIINNTFINRPSADQDEFLAKFSPTFYNRNPNIGSVRDVSEHFFPDDIVTSTRNRFDQMSDEKLHTDVSSNDSNDNGDLNYITELSSKSIDESVPLGSIITAILWIFLILFWFLLYLKVLNVYNPLPKAIPEPKPTNYELCLMICRKFGIFISQLWKF